MNDAGCRVLVVDNYDSFTYNLVHYLRDIAGRKPLVVTKDDLAFTKVCNLDQFDLIVLSPGPGNPATDSGCVTQMILAYFFDQPSERRHPVLLGVCMGYEEIAHRLGVPSIRTVPRHGLLWPVRIDHSADDGSLFLGCPDTIQQVRYHSLILSPESLANSSGLILTATALDVIPSSCAPQTRLEGPLNDPETTEQWRQDLSLWQTSETSQSEHQVEIPMAFRHRTLPVYGVQFHPESILSEFGKEIIKNACRIANIPFLEKACLEGLTSVPVRASAEHTSACTHVFRLKNDDMKDASISIFFNLFYSLNQRSVWLDSPHETTGRWSFMSTGGSLYVQTNEGVYLHSGSDLGISQNSPLNEFLLKFEEYANSFPKIPVVDISADQPPIRAPALFTCMGYEAFHSDTTGGDLRSVFLIANRIVAIDNESGNVFAVSVSGNSDWITELPCLVAEAVSRGSHVEQPPLSEANVSEFTMRDSQSCYMEKVRACQSAIERGESYELCLTTSVSGEIPIAHFDPLRTYALLRQFNPSQFGAFFHIPELGVSVLSASPERFLKIDGSTGVAEVKPIKGTRRRGKTPGEDEAIREELENSAKDRAENLMIVDLVRSDLSIVCDKVHCPILMEVETYKPYHQLVSTVRGRVTTSLSKVVASLFPAGSMTGAPKIRSMKILEAIEGNARGLGYSGAIGYISPVTGSVDLSVVIRTIYAIWNDENSSNVKLSMGAGGAILALSDPLDEWREMLLKARRSLAVLARSTGAPGITVRFADDSRSVFIRGAEIDAKHIITTMRYEAGKGIWLFDRHLKRLQVSRNIALEVIQEAAKGYSGKGRGPALTEGPFKGIASLEWVMCDLGPVDACIRIAVSSSGELSCSFRDLEFDNPDTVALNTVRVDSCDTALTKKSTDWFVPGTQGRRDRTLLATELDLITETGIANVAIRSGDEWITPDSKAICILPGTLRSMLIDQSLIREDFIPLEDGLNAQEFICFNSVRGVFTVSLEYLATAWKK